MHEPINNQRLARLAGVDFDSEIIKPGPLVYTRTHTAVEQFDKLATYGPCALLTSFSDADLTDKMADMLPANVTRWFSNNVMSTRPWVTPIPLGMRTSISSEKVIAEVQNRGRLKQRNLCYMNFWRQIHRKPNPRCGIYEELGGKSWITTQGGFGHVPMLEFYENIAAHPYVISPPGAGPDCHRHWESIMLGAIPIVKWSVVTSILKDFPCLFVDYWGQVTEELLKRALPILQKKFKTCPMQMVYFEYWKTTIEKEVACLADNTEKI